MLSGRPIGGIGMQVGAISWEICMGDVSMVAGRLIDGIKVVGERCQGGRSRVLGRHVDGNREVC
jgi:hypothetical protein